MADKPRKPRIRRRRIIERPRLIRALDRSNARIRLLIGASGYGKTILAEQWAPREGRVPGWFRAGRPAADVAVVARALVAAAAVSVPDAGRRLLERLAATQDPQREAALLAEMLAEDLDTWPADAWIVIDDYEHLAVSAASEEFVRTVVDRSPVRLLVAGRVRPSWVEPRSILDGDVFEIPQTALTMSLEEVEEIVGADRPELTAGLVALGGGWPSLVGLAGMTPDAPENDADRPDALLEFFADELWRRLDTDVRNGLAILAAMPLVDRELAETILGPERAEHVCGQALSLGLLDERDGRLDMHPLVRMFIEGRTGAPSSALAQANSRALALFRRRHEWDAAFELVRRNDLGEELAGLVLEAVDETVHGGRLMALEEWVRWARTRGLPRHPVFAVAETELHVRHGRHLSGLTVARAALDAGTAVGDVEYRLLLAAARAAHVGSREEDALTYYKRARPASALVDAGARSSMGRVDVYCRARAA